jgi:hypothetical protein
MNGHNFQFKNPLPFVSEFMSQNVDCITLHGMVNNKL